jgi:type III pantothenate kinase
MFLAIDIGNSETKFALFRNDSIAAEWRLSSKIQATADELADILQPFYEQAHCTEHEIQGVGISSVVPYLTELYSALVRHRFSFAPVVITPDIPLEIAIHYKNPALLGPDRLCNAVAGFAKYGGPLIIVDLGTATTYDVIDSNGDFLGGVIAPGIGTTIDALHTQTALLPEIPHHVPATIIGTDTISSIQSGIFWGAVDGMGGILQRIQRELQQQGKPVATVVATGGFSSFIRPYTECIQFYEPSLVLEGIRLIARRVSAR